MATLVAPENFSAIQDAEALHKACEGNTKTTGTVLCFIYDIDVGLWTWFELVL